MIGQEKDMAVTDSTTAKELRREKMQMQGWT